MSSGGRIKLGVIAFFPFALCACVEERPGYDGAAETPEQRRAGEGAKEVREAAALLSMANRNRPEGQTPFESAALCSGAIAAMSQRVSDLPLFTNEHRKAFAQAGAHFHNLALQRAPAENLSEQQASRALADAQQKSAEDPSAAVQLVMGCVSRPPEP